MTFEEIKIGKQVWMKHNLNVDTFRNGDPNPHAESDEHWEEAKYNNEPAWCYYDNDPANGAVYGKLYNLYAVNDPRGLTPEGWHVPSDDEWTTLTDHLGAKDVAGTKMKSTSGWEEDGNGTNESGFSGLPGGFRDFKGDGAFYNVGKHGNWWSSTEAATRDAWSRLLDYYDGDLYRNFDSKGTGFSVRCLRD